MTLRFLAANVQFFMKLLRKETIVSSRIKLLVLKLHCKITFSHDFSVVNSAFLRCNNRSSMTASSSNFLIRANGMTLEYNSVTAVLCGTKVLWPSVSCEMVRV